MEQADYYIHKGYKEHKNSNKLIIIVMLFFVLIILILIVGIFVQGKLHSSKTNTKKESLGDITGNAISNYKNNYTKETTSKPPIKNGGTNVTRVINPEPKVIRTHTPVKLGPNDVLVSFRIDDITFMKNDKIVLENALYLARKYNITFDLAVVAQPFDTKRDNNTYQIYLDNQDVFEVVAHGLYHRNFKGASYEDQEQNVILMKNIFEKYNLIWGTKILALPWSTGDNNTIEIANNNGYMLMSLNKDLCNCTYNLQYKIIIIDYWVGIIMNDTLNNYELQYRNSTFNRLIKQKKKDIQIIMHPINFYKLENSDVLISVFVNNNTQKSNIKFSMISDRFFN